MIRRTQGSVICVAVTYHPDEAGLRALLESLAPQVDTVLLVDNTPAGSLITEHILATMGDPGWVRLVRCGANLGIAAAQNIGIRAAIAEGYDFILLSDQDSRPDPGMVDELRDLIVGLESEGVRVGAVFPQYIDQITDLESDFQVQRPDKWFYSSVPGNEAMPWIEVLSGIASGTLARSCVYEHVGLMREDYFIDHVDIEWSHRARSLGYRLFGTSKVRIAHNLGDSSFQVWYMKWRPYSVYSPQRLYYRFRNFVTLCKAPYVPFRWKLRASWFWLGNLYAYALFCKGRPTNIRYMIRGLWDGALGRSGPINE